MAAAHRIPSYNKSRLPAVVVQFHDRDIKEALLSKFREAKTRSYHLTADKINRAFPPGRVYVNDHLTPENKQFLAMLKKKCHDVGYVFVWCRDGKFFVRKAAGERVHRVSTLDDIDKLKFGNKENVDKVELCNGEIVNNPKSVADNINDHLIGVQGRVSPGPLARSPLPPLSAYHRGHYRQRHNSFS
ncbi:polycystic kidney disease protein 1-like [Homalodisca vitripennis]|nr:polycystic kidney disease protein 1-like [Homalodisca vitripennis]